MATKWINDYVYKIKPQSASATLKFQYFEEVSHKQCAAFVRVSQIFRKGVKNILNSNHMRREFHVVPIYNEILTHALL